MSYHVIVRGEYIIGITSDYQTAIKERPAAKYYDWFEITEIEYLTYKSWDSIPITLINGRPKLRYDGGKLK